jgi:hypothetical protein
VLANPEALSQIKAHVPLEALQMFGYQLAKAKSILANSLGMVFLAGATMAILGLLSTIFFREVPCQGVKPLTKVKERMT